MSETDTDESVDEKRTETRSLYFWVEKDNPKENMRALSHA